jgi:hypothetical protein
MSSVLFFITLAFATTEQDFRINIMKYCKQRENTLQQRIECVSFFVDCEIKIENNNIIYGTKESALVCRNKWEKERL